MKFDIKNVSSGTITRTIILLIALVNQILAYFGISPLQIADEDIGTVVTILFTVGASVAAWWKNNSFTKTAIQADMMKQNLKTKNTIN